MKRLLLSCIILMGSGYNLIAQLGCTDSLAINFNPAAIENDGSCLYAAQQISLQYKGNLSSEINETSGLIFIHGDLWTMNDSGHLPEIYQLDTATGKIIRKVFISNAINVDWEAITADESYLYIGDFGNNATGNRQDLKIYKIDYSLLRNIYSDTVEAETIQFAYEDQQLDTSINFSKPNTGKFDCEAFLAFGDSLHIFTKDWDSYQTRHYTVPTNPGRYEAFFKNEFNVGGLITDAAISSSGIIALAGYSSNFRSTFIWLFSDYNNNNFFSGNKRYLEAGAVINVLNRNKDIGQLEAISFSGPSNGFTTSEGINQKVAGIRIKTEPRWHSFNINGHIGQPEYFSFIMHRDSAISRLEWKPINIKNIQQVILQRSGNNKVYTDIGNIQQFDEQGKYTYQTDQLFHYRLKIIRKEGGIFFAYPKKTE